MATRRTKHSLSDSQSEHEHKRSKPEECKEPYDRKLESENDPLREYKESPYMDKQSENQTRQKLKEISNMNKQSGNQTQQDFKELSGTSKLPEETDAFNQWAADGNVAENINSSVGSEFQSEKMQITAHTSLMQDMLDRLGTQRKPSSVGNGSHNQTSAGGKCSKKEKNQLVQSFQWDNEEDSDEDDDMDEEEDLNEEEAFDNTHAYDFSEVVEAFTATLREIKVLRNLYINAEKKSVAKIAKDVADIICLLENLRQCMDTLLKIIDERVENEQQLEDMVKWINWFGPVIDRWRDITPDELRRLYESETPGDYHTKLHPLLKKVDDMADELQELHRKLSS